MQDLANQDSFLNCRLKKDMPCVSLCPLYDQKEKGCTLELLGEGLRAAIPQVLNILPAIIEVQENIIKNTKALISKVKNGKITNNG